MQPLTPEEYERLNTDADLSVAAIQQHVKNVDGLSHLPEEIRKAYAIKRALTRRLKWQRLVRFLHR
jgi:hypothetical protein